MNKFVVRLTALLVCALFAYILYLIATFPDVKSLRGCVTTTMYKVNLCPSSGHYTNINNISANLVNAIVVSEDGSFFSHNGFDVDEIKNSIEANLKKNQMARGGSTITQQLIKNVFLSKEKSLVRKAKEAILTWQIEKEFTKKQILEKYLNVIEFGKNIYGITDAAKFYFNTTPSQLSIAQSAYLAHLLPSPIKYSQGYFRKELSKYNRSQTSTIIGRLYKFKKISEAEHDTALADLNAFPWGAGSAKIENAPTEKDVKEDEDESDGDSTDDIEETSTH